MIVLSVCVWSQRAITLCSLINVYVVVNFNAHDGRQTDRQIDGFLLASRTQAASSHTSPSVECIYSMPDVCVGVGAVQRAPISEMRIADNLNHNHRAICVTVYYLRHTSSNNAQT